MQDRVQIGDELAVIHRYCRYPIETTDTWLSALGAAPAGRKRIVISRLAEARGADVGLESLMTGLLLIAMTCTPQYSTSNIRDNLQAHKSGTS